ncbi:aromatic prenyltransferase [Amycolatopsis nigrescens]|uniref:aromatic prenyltransferase n=1 Tax=Amycolatopsis nigrescens TaxID=381445 RepID=UPI00035D56B2|nr:aromatic prenyltransferase [Amycolatopsis nigrescens]
MSENAELERIYSVIEETAQLVDVACSRAKVWPVLTTFGDTLAQAAIAFRVATGARYVGELDCRFSIRMDVDPYSTALSNGLTEETDHPIGALLSEIHDRFPIETLGVDFGVVGGFRKIYAFFPGEDLQSLSKAADMPSMPRSLAGNLDFFTRYGLSERVTGISIDYPSRTTNVYFGWTPADRFDTKTVLSMLRDLELPDPSEQMLTVAKEAFGMYLTLSWDSPKILRFCFPMPTPDPTTLPVQLEPKIEQFTRGVSRGSAMGKYVYAATSTPDGEYYKLSSYYQWRPQVIDLPTGWRADSTQSPEPIADPV